MNRRIGIVAVGTIVCASLAYGGYALADSIHPGNPQEAACVSYGTNRMYYDYNLGPCQAGQYKVVWNYIPLMPAPTVTKTVTVSPTPSTSASASATP